MYSFERDPVILERAAYQRKEIALEVIKCDGVPQRELTIQEQIYWKQEQNKFLNLIKGL